MTGYLETLDIDFTVMVAQEWAFLLSGTALGSLAALLLVCCLGLCSIGALLNTRDDAVRRLHGHGLLRSAGRSLARAGGAVVPSPAVTAGVAIILAGCGTNWLSAGQWASNSLLISGVGLGVCAGTVTAAFAVLRRVRIVPVLAGRVASAPAVATVSLVRVGACVAVAAMSVSAFNYGTEYLRQTREAQVWSASPTAYRVSSNGARSLEDIHTDTGRVAENLREQSAAGDLLVARYLDAGMTRHAGIRRDILVFNSSAAEVSLRGAISDSYACAREQSGGQPVLLRPEGALDSTEDAGVRSAVGVDPSTREFTYPSGDSTAMTWEIGDSEWMNRAFTQDPLVVVFPDDKIGMDDRTLVAALSQGDVFLRDYDDFRELQRDPVTGTFMRAAVPAAQVWSTHHQEMGRSAWTMAGGLVIAVLLAVVSSLAVLDTFLKVFHQRLRAAFVHGVVPVRHVAGVTGLELAVLATVAAYLWHRGAAVREWSEGGELAGAADPSLMAMFSVPDSAWLAALLIVVATSLPVVTVAAGKTRIRDLVHERR
ncbi:hypothetical protein [Corynebacterium frankenforstense]